MKDIKISSDFMCLMVLVVVVSSRFYVCDGGGGGGGVHGVGGFYCIRLR